jgi:MoCo/4Fe-4S cofactor protein with predicted Tat translocation signal
MPPVKKPLDLDELRARLSEARGPRYWRSLEEVAGTEEFQDYLKHEFPANADQWAAEGVNRRRFLQLMSASFALAGLTACVKQPVEKIVPYIEQPEEITPGIPLFFATALPWRGYGIGVLAESHMGRPTKIEGNPDHPASRGGASIFEQASILSLYDPNRAKVVSHAGTIATWDAFVNTLTPTLEGLSVTRGAGLRILTGTVTSPTLAWQMRAILEKFPEARWHQYEAAARDARREGLRMVFGEDLEFHHRFDLADVALTLDDDFLAGSPSSLREARDFASRRRVRRDDPRMSRLYALESTPGLAGAIADHRLPLRPSEIESFARALAREIGIDAGAPGALPLEATRWVSVVARDLKAHRGAGLVTAGETQPAAVHAVVHAINGALANAGRTVLYTDPVEAVPTLQMASLRELAQDMDAGKVDLLLVVGGNPVFTAPADLEFGERMKKVRMAVHLSMAEDETSEWSHWTIPEAHPLESWGDLRAFDGTATIQQPLIAPLYGGKAACEVLSAFLGKPGRSAHDIVKGYWKERFGGLDFESFWKKSLHDGVVADTALPARTAAVPAGLAFRAPAAAAAAPGQLEVVFRPDPTVWDGEFADNGWLQELAKPFSKLTWDNAALISPATAQRLGVQNEQVVRIESGGRVVEAPAWILPGQPDGCVTAHLGYGRTRVGPVGQGTGFRAGAIRTSAAPWSAPARLSPTGARRDLATTQHHSSMEGRELVRVASLDRFRREPDFAQKMDEAPPPSLTLYPAYPYDDYKWGMSIDLNTCVGCNACVIACQSENNIPVVGKEQVQAGREMQWIRIDRYYHGSLDNPHVYHEPVPCMHCENAPCEVVCPVGATVHSSEGLNQMIYNRCVGTRYCSNNCPYKVRRFNFLQYSDEKTTSLKLMRNPDVTVRSRGVMEKCSYCVQRIAERKIVAERENRRIRDGELVTACQQTCPTEAIVFGDLNDAKSRVVRAKAEPLDYGLLTELNTRPRTTYLARVRNPNPELPEE